VIPQTTLRTAGQDRFVCTTALIYK